MEIPEVTFENSPQQVEIKLVKNEKSMWISKEDLQRAFDKVMQEVENNGGDFGAIEFRRLAEQGINIFDICVKNIPIGCIKEGFRKWLNNL